MTLLTLLHCAACSVVVYACFCRLAITSRDNVRPSIRVALAALGGAAAVSIAAPFALIYEPNWPGVLLVSAVANLLIATSGQWRHGVPKHLRAET